MKFLKIMLVILVVNGMAAVIFAQGRVQGRGMGQGLNQNSMRPYYGMKNQLDVNNPIMFDGKITKIETVRLWSYSRGGIQLTVKDKKGIRLIQMGPEFYFVEKKIIFKIGDKLKGISYKGEYNKKPYLFAVNIEINGKKILLRDKKGLAVWRNSLRYGRGQGRGRVNRQGNYK